MSMLPPVFVELKANIGEFQAKMGEARHELGKLEKQGATSFQKFGAIAKATFLATGAVAVGIGAMAVKSADEFEKAHAKLEVAMKNAGTNYDEYKSKIKAVTEAQTKYGYTSAETENALAVLTTSLKDPKKALDDLQIATDLAKYKGIDLASASLLVAKAAEGQVRPLKALGIDLPVTAGGAAKLEKANNELAKAQKKLQDIQADPNHTSKQLQDAQDKVAEKQAKVNDVAQTGSEIMAGLAAAVGGQAAAASDTFAGKMDTLKASTENVLTTLGMALMPTLIDLVGYIQSDIVPWVQQFVAGLTGTGGAEEGLNKVKTSAENMGTAVKDVLGFIKDNKHFLEDMAAAFAAFWTVTKISSAVTAITGALKLINGAFATTTTAGILAGEAEAVGTGGLSAGPALAGAAAIAAFFGMAGMQLISSGNNSNVDPRAGGGRAAATPGGARPGQIYYSHAPIVPTEKSKYVIVDGKKIPVTATGGIVTGPQVRMVGEAGPEAIIPLSRGGLGLGMTVHVHVAGSVIRERDLAVTVRDEIAQLMRRKGLNPSILGV